MALRANISVETVVSYAALSGLMLAMMATRAPPLREKARSRVSLLSLKGTKVELLPEASLSFAITVAREKIDLLMFALSAIVFFLVPGLTRSLPARSQKRSMGTRPCARLTRTLRIA